MVDHSSPGSVDSRNDADAMVDPWSASGDTDYNRIIEQFGLEPVKSHHLPEPDMLHRRGIIFAHRDLDLLLSAKRRGEPFGVLTGLMPSGRMHLGHKMVVDQIGWFQRLGADVTIAVADLEAYATRGVTLEKSHELALSEYISNYAALGLDVENTSVYYQSRRPIVSRLGFVLSRRTNLSEMEAIYGFNGETNLAHVQSPFVQTGDIMHPQLDEYGGLRPIVVPVGVDQDPHLRLCRGMVSKTNWFNVKGRKGGGLVIGLSIQPDNSAQLGVREDGSLDKSVRQRVVDGIVSRLKNLGYGDILPNPKHGSIQLPSATKGDRDEIRMMLLEYERKLGGLGLLQPSSTYHRFAPGLTGEKMSSSMPESSIFLSDTVKVAEKKVGRSVTGGRVSVEEQREKGGEPDRCSIFQLYTYHFQTDDHELSNIRQQCTSGNLLCGECKGLAKQLVGDWLGNHSEMRDQTEHLVSEFISLESR